MAFLNQKDVPESCVTGVTRGKIEQNIYRQSPVKSPDIKTL